MKLLNDEVFNPLRHILRFDILLFKDAKVSNPDKQEKKLKSPKGRPKQYIAILLLLPLLGAAGSRPLSANARLRQAPPTVPARGPAENADITLASWVEEEWESSVVEIVYVEGGSFTMGSTDGSNDEGPVHSVTVDSFYMTETEVTHRQYLEFLNDAGVSASGRLNGSEVIDMDDDDVAFSHNGKEFSFAASSYADDIDCPVIEVTWYGAVEYSNWLSEQAGLTKAYSISGTSVNWNQNAEGYRLPTEAEWEYAARGGVQSKGYKYAGSNNVGEVGWDSGNSGRETHPVKGKKANELGLYDMSGNVWEWCWDWYDSDYYSSSPENNPVGPPSGSSRVLRGGGWGGNLWHLRVANRGGSPGNGDSNDGFRLVRPTD